MTTTAASQEGAAQRGLPAGTRGGALRARAASLGAWGWRQLPAALAAGSVAAAVAGYAIANSRLWFFGDDWAFLLRRGVVHDPVRNLLTPHNEHWSTIPVLIYRFLFTVFGLRHYLPYVIPVLLAHAGVCALLWVLLRRNGAAPWPAAGGLVLMAVCGAGAENLLWDFQIGFVGAVFFGLFALLLVDRSVLRLGHLVSAWVLACCALMCSGIGVPMVAGLAAFTLLRHGRWAALRVVSVPAVVFLAWYAAYGSAGTARDRTPLGVRLHSASFFWTGVTHVWDANTGVAGAGLIVIGLLSVPLLLVGTRDPLGRVATALLFAMLVQFGLITWTRVRFGLPEATASRYVYIGTALSMPSLVWLLDRSGRWVRAHGGLPAVPAIGAVVAIALTLGNLGDQAHRYFVSRQHLVQGSRSRILAAAELEREQVVTLSGAPDPHYSPDVNLSELRRPGVFDTLPRPVLSQAELLTARGQLQVLVGPAPVPVPVATEALLIGEPIPFTASACQTRPVFVGSRLVLDTGPAGGRAEVSAPGSTLLTYLVSDGLASPPLPWRISNERPEYVGTSDGSAQLVVLIPAGGLLSVCLE